MARAGLASMGPRWIHRGDDFGSLLAAGCSKLQWGRGGFTAEIYNVALQDNFNSFSLQWGRGGFTAEIAM